MLLKICFASKYNFFEMMYPTMILYYIYCSLVNNYLFLILNYMEITLQPNSTQSLIVHEHTRTSTTLYNMYVCMYVCMYWIHSRYHCYMCSPLWLIIWKFLQIYSSLLLYSIKYHSMHNLIVILQVSVVWVYRII